MSAINSLPNISADEVAIKLESKEKFILLDVCEYIEKNYVRIQDSHVLSLPMSHLTHRALDTFPENLYRKDQKIIIFCHHGVRNVQVVAWLKSMGWQNVFNMHGEIDAYASFVNPNVGSYLTTFVNFIFFIYFDSVIIHTNL